MRPVIDLEDDAAPGPPDRAPLCGRCKLRHLVSLPCWGGHLVRGLRPLVLARYGDRCHLCRRRGADTLDHVVPRSLGGLDTLDNLRPAHGFCNTGRGARPAPVLTEVSKRW